MRIMNRRAFVGTMGVLGTAAILEGCSPESKSTEGGDTAEAPSEVSWAPVVKNETVVPLFPESGPIIYTDEEVEQILNNPAIVTEDFENEDGSTISPAYQMLRNYINRNGFGMGSMITKDHQLDLWPHLFTEEEAQAYIKMPMYKMFSAADFAKESGQPEEECLEICNTIADRGLLRRVYRDNEPLFNTLGSEYGYYEAYIQHFDKEYLDLKELNNGDDFMTAVDSETPGWRTLPVNLDIVVDGNYTQWDDWRDIFKRNDTFAVSPCMCRSQKMIKAGVVDNVQDMLADDLLLDCKHPVETCIVTGVQAEYFIDIAAGREISADEAVAIVENAVSKGMIVDALFTKAVENVCLCHADCCDYVGPIRAVNGGPMMKNQSNFHLVHQLENCIKCGACKVQCPMYSIVMDEEDGYPVVDSACVRCGQCATVCPQGARGLLLYDEDELPYIPEDMLEDNMNKARHRISKGYLYDITSQSDMAAIVAEQEAKA